MSAACLLTELPVASVSRAETLMELRCSADMDTVLAFSRTDFSMCTVLPTQAVGYIFQAEVQQVALAFVDFRIAS